MPFPFNLLQRHCRLKHSGDILIEISGAKIEKARHPFEDLMKPKIPKLTARPLEDLQQPNRATKPSFLIYPSISNQRPMVPASDLFEEQHSANSCLASMLKVEMKPDDCDEPMDVQEIPEPVTNQIVLENHSPVGKITKRYQCELCPYETDSKSQFLYHKSFHRPKNSSYQCKYCSYNVSRRHLLSQHMKMHRQGEAGASEQEDGNDVQLIPIESSHGLEKLMHFCGLCPARYLSLKEISTHLQLHESDGEYRCDFCTFSSSDESFVKSHATVHSTYYQEKTKEFLAKYKMATHFESPELFAVKQNEFGLSEDIWIVKGAEAPRSQSDDHVTTSADKCPYCPLQAPPGVLKDHMQGHLAISGMDRMAKCAHCDYSADEVNSLKDHIKLHFMTLLGGPGKTNVDMFSNFRNLELSITKIPNSSTSNDTNNNNVGGETTSIFKENEMHMADDELPKDRIIIDV